MRYRLLLAFTPLLLLGATARPVGQDPGPLDAARRLANAEMERRGESLAFGGAPNARWDYASGLFALALIRLSERTGDESYARYAEKVIGSYIAADGAIRGYKLDEYNIDQINSGKAVLALWRRTKEERYQRAAALLRSQLVTQPRTSEGGFWHKQRYPHQMWLDGLYMGAPFYAEYAKLFDEPAAFEDVTRQFLLIDKHTYDAKAGLHYHGWDEARTQEWANKETGTSPNFWGRAEGWYAMALVDALDHIPAAQRDLEAMIGVLRRVADGIVRYQDPSSGVWWQVLDQGGRQGNYLEATASCMFVYALAKAVNKGYLPHEYAATAEKGWAGIQREFVRSDANGRMELIKNCAVAGLGYGRDGSYEYYLREPIRANDLKGIGPFILAGIELDQLRSRPLSKATRSTVLGWALADEIVGRVQAPQFPARDFPITSFGAVGDGKKDATVALRRAIEACHKAGGGRVVVPQGTFLTGAIHLQSGVNLHLVSGAVLRFRTDPAAYPRVLTRWEGVECRNYSPLIYAFEQENIAVTGPGTLDGQADWDNWWGWTRKGQPTQPKQRSDRDALFEMGERGVPVDERLFGEGHFLRPSFIETYRCRNVLIEGVTILRSPMWEIHPALSTNVTVRGVTIRSHGPNNDGCDPESSRDVIIEDSVFDTGDDCIAIKSGRNNDGRRVGVPSENILVRRCRMADGHGGVVIGSEISGGCKNVFVDACEMDSPNLDRALRVKSNARRGGTIENVFMRNTRIGRVSEAVVTVDFLYEEGALGDFPPTLRHVELDGVTSSASPRVLWLAGFPGATIDDVRISNSTFSGLTDPDLLRHVGRIVLEKVILDPAARERSRNSPPAPAPAAVPVQ